MFEDFYDRIAEHFHLIFQNWDASIAWQADVLGPLIERACGTPAPRVLDCACGIGTQALGLAARGHRVTGSDVSAPAVARAEREAAGRGLDIAFYAADMRDLSTVPGDNFDAVIAADNSLPHLLSEQDLAQALASIAAMLIPGGAFLATIRDYDRLIRERPSVQPPAFYSDAGRRRFVHQVWDWLDERRYVFHLYVTRDTGSAWECLHFAGLYRAVLREELSQALAAAGFEGIRWLAPAESRYYQPVVVATRGT